LASGALDGTTSKALTVITEDRLQLESIARSQSLPAGIVKRAQMVRHMADGESNTNAARRKRVNRPTVTMSSNPVDRAARDSSVYRTVVVPS
jgi:hypothetical protein